MDLFTFKLVVNATDTFQQRKKYARLAQSVALLSEMMHLLHVMYQSKESTEQIMAMGLMDRLFCANEPLDRLPKPVGPTSVQPTKTTLAFRIFCSSAKQTNHFKSIYVHKSVVLPTLLCHCVEKVPEAARHRILGRLFCSKSPSKLLTVPVIRLVHRIVIVPSQ